ncbi:MAG: short subunit dehydrogenase-like uncharacterized protein [Limisphaerales bacterium]|jgi:short subunit dehydrogenase-like uncharacterized protein
MNDFLIYGCNGYTGRLICELAYKKGLKPILAGRNEVEVSQLAQKYEWDYLVFALNDSVALKAALENVKMILHCAGPFQHTMQPVYDACLKTKTHYVDITGELSVFEYLKACGQKAAGEGIMLLPGAGFDVVPSDCLAAWLANKLPNAEQLNLALYSPGGKLSHGTANTVIENIGEGGKIRVDGLLKKVRHAYDTKTFDFGFAVRKGVTIPWGDVSTAYTSTGIKNIRVYNCAPISVQRGMKLANYLGWLLSAPLIQSFLKKRLKKKVFGPSTEERAANKSYILGEVTAKGKKVSGLLEMPDGYSLTASTAINITEKIIAGNFTPGYQTPSSAYGSELIMELENVKRKLL